MSGRGCCSGMSVEMILNTRRSCCYACWNGQPTAILGLIAAVQIRRARCPDHFLFCIKALANLSAVPHLVPGLFALPLRRSFSARRGVSGVERVHAYPRPDHSNIVARVKATIDGRLEFMFRLCSVELTACSGLLASRFPHGTFLGIVRAVSPASIPSF